MMDACIKKLMNLSIGWEQFLNQNGAGEKVYNTAVTLKCYKKGGHRVIRNVAGEEVLSREVLYLDGTAQYTAQITTADRITNVAGLVYQVLDVQPYYDGQGNLDLVEVYI